MFVANEPLGVFDPAGLSFQPPATPPGTILVPGVPSAGWIYHPPIRPGGRGFWVPNVTVPGQVRLSYDPLGHYDLEVGGRTIQRFDPRGNPISARNAHANPHRRPKRGPGSLGGAALAIGCGAVAGLNAAADSGLFSAVYAAARAGASREEIDDLMFEAAVDAAIESGQAGALPGIYGPWWWLN